MKKNRNKKIANWVLILLIIVAIIVIVRLLLPVVILHYANEKLEENPDYEGRIGGVDLSIIAGNYSLSDIKIDKVDSQIKEPLIEIDEIWFSIDYSSLLNNKIVGEIEFVKPVINFVKGPTKEETQEEVDKSLAQTINEIMPIEIERLRVTDGKIRYMDFSTEPNIDIQAYDINIKVTNLTTLPKEDELLPAGVTGSANTTGQGRVDLFMKLDPFNPNPTFDLNLELKDLKLNSLNDFLKAYANFDVEKGTFSLFTEIAARNGNFKGYVKPLINDLKVAPFEAEDKGVLQKLYEAGIAVVTDIFESPGPKKDQLGTKIPIAGKFEDPNVKVWTAVVYLLRNAFVQALVPSIEHSIEIGEESKVKGDEKENKEN